MRMLNIFSAALGVLLMGSSAQATVMTGNINDWSYVGDAPVYPWLLVGDGTNHVTFSWSLGGAHTGYFNGSSYLEDSYPDSNVAFATGVTNISQIADASIFSFNAGQIGPYFDATLDPDGVGDFIVARNISTGHYGVLRIDDIQDQTFNDGFVDHRMGILNGTWWFQTDGTGDFSSVSSVPEPEMYAMISVGLFALFSFGRLRKQS